LIPTRSELVIVIAVASALELMPSTPPLASAKDKVPEPSVTRTCPFVPSLVG